MDFDQLETFHRGGAPSPASRGRRRSVSAPSRRFPHRFAPWKKKFGAKLLDRSGRKGFFHGPGKLFLKYSLKIRSTPAKPCITAIAETERVPRGEIVVGANEGTCLHILPEVFADFKKQYPDVSVNIKPGGLCQGSGIGDR